MKRLGTIDRLNRIQRELICVLRATMYIGQKPSNDDGKQGPRIAICHWHVAWFDSFLNGLVNIRFESGTRLDKLTP